MRLLIVVLLLFVTASAANAYTLVMRDGRRVEIPNEFTVTNSTLTYEVGSGVQITVQLAAVDVAATERANGQPNGALLLKASTPKAPVIAEKPMRATRSITNRDLEAYQRVREQNELAYEKKRKELGLPSLEERRREVAEIQDRTVEQVRSMRAQEEAYWRSRADALRAEMAANEAQRGLSQQRSEELPLSYPFGGYSGFWPFDNVGFGITAGPFNRFRRFPSSPFDSFLATPITPFPTFPLTPAFRGGGRTPVFRAPGVRSNARPFQMRRGSHR
ncbi:MAG TPA: hypothetical protein VKA97_04295 [Pyrinomonadaceae bacterium]|nr:hypothetical protein [Pyrinomonadaceae bacterium]